MPQQFVRGVACTPAFAAAMTIDFGASVTIATAPGPLATVKLGLIGTLNGGATPSQVFGNIVLPVYDTYAVGATVVWGVQLNEGDGSLSVLSQLYTFQQTGSTGDTIRGAYLATPGGSPVLYALCLFNPAITLVNAGDGFTIVVAWNMQSATIAPVSFNVDY